MKIIAAPDSFKGSLSSEKFCEIVKSCAEKSAGKIEAVCFPLADGGEGTMRIITNHFDGKIEKCTVNGPLGGTVEAEIGFIDSGYTAVIECAEAIGLTLVKGRENPLAASTYGVGQMISAATSRGANHIILSLGGSCTNDCGAGMLSAMGVRFTDICGNIIEPTGGSLERIERIEFTSYFNKYRDIEFTVLTDVQNPLLGKNGCAAVFAPQKGADEKAVRCLERGAARFASVVRRVTCENHAEDPGAGAAGGLGFAAFSFFNAKAERGAARLLDMYGFGKALSGCDAVITGEGRFDRQSIMGKAVGAVLERSGSVPVTVFCGSSDTDGIGFDKLPGIIEISAGVDEKYAMTHAEELLLAKLTEYFDKL